MLVTRFTLSLPLAVSCVGGSGFRHPEHFLICSHRLSRFGALFSNFNLVNFVKGLGVPIDIFVVLSNLELDVATVVEVRD